MSSTDGLQTSPKKVQTRRSITVCEVDKVYIRRSNVHYL